MDEFTYEGAGQRQWSDSELFPRAPLQIPGMDAGPPQQTFQQPMQPQMQQQPMAQPGQGSPRQQEPLFVAPGTNPQNDPFAPPSARSYAHPRLAPTWQHASVGAVAGTDTVDAVHRLLVIGLGVGLGYAATGSWKGAASGGLLGIGVNQIGQFALTKSLPRLLAGLGGLGGGGYWMWKLKGGRLPAAIANHTPKWLKPCTENCGDGPEE
ncbi:MAG: hypothetical protein WC683_02365 [bacterium]